MGNITNTNNNSIGVINMNYKVGDVVVIRRNLVAGKIYYGDTTRVSEYCCEEMSELAGMEAIITSEDKGYYTINLDGGECIYVEGMFAGFANKVLEDHENYTSNKEVEDLIFKSLKLVPNQLINDALDKNDKKRFKELSDKFYTEDSK